MMQQFLDTVPKAIVPHLHKVEVPPEEPILLAGQPGRHLYILLAGSAQGYMQTQSGSLMPVFLYQPVSLFGEVELFCRRGNTIGISAMTACTLYRIEQAYFLQWMQADFEFTCYVIRQLAEKLTESSSRVEKLSLLSVRQRVLRCVALRHQSGTLPALTKEALAVEANAPVRSVNRAIARCCAEGIFGFEKKHFFVLDEAALARHLPQPE